MYIKNIFHILTWIQVYIKLIIDGRRSSGAGHLFDILTYTIVFTIVYFYNYCLDLCIQSLINKERNSF